MTVYRAKTVIRRGPGLEGGGVGGEGSRVRSCLTLYNVMGYRCRYCRCYSSLERGCSCIPILTISSCTCSCSASPCFFDVLCVSSTLYGSMCSMCVDNG